MRRAPPFGRLPARQAVERAQQSKEAFDRRRFRKPDVATLPIEERRKRASREPADFRLGQSAVERRANGQGDNLAPLARNLALTPGKHKVTFVIRDDRFTYPVTIKQGSTETMSKDLQ